MSENRAASDCRVAIYGGSFNPIHRGHTALANAICSVGLVDEVWLMVSPLNPFKQADEQHILPTWLRIKLARIATAPYRRLHVSDLESSMPTPSYTVTTLERLEAIFPTYRFSLLMGEDNWQGFDNWYRADYIRSHHDLIIYQRQPDSARGEDKGGAAPNADSSFFIFNSSFPQATVTVHRPDGTSQCLSDSRLRLYPISSTQIRQAIRRGDEPFLRQWLHGSVANYILRHPHLFTC